jgi:hypothetical protein
MFYQMTQQPVVVGGLAVGLGYAWSMVRGVEIPVSPELVAFVRREQMQRLKKVFVSKSKPSVAQAVTAPREN